MEMVIDFSSQENVTTYQVRRRNARVPTYFTGRDVMYDIIYKMFENLIIVTILIAKETVF